MCHGINGKGCLAMPVHQKMNQNTQKMINYKFRRAISFCQYCLAYLIGNNHIFRHRMKKGRKITYWVNQEGESRVKSTFFFFFLMCPLSSTVMMSVEATTLKSWAYSTQRNSLSRMFLPSWLLYRKLDCQGQQKRASLVWSFFPRKWGL